MKKILSLVVCICLLIGCSTIAASAANLGWAWPVPASNSISGCFTDGRNHNAIDISAPKGSTVISAYTGKVIDTNTTCSHNYAKLSSCGCSGGRGNYIYILSSFNGQNYVSRYCHLSTVNVSVGQNVSKGQTIGTVGSTGYSMDFHLDYQIYIPTSGNNFNASRFVDPLMDGFLEVPAGLNANASSTSCCDEYVYKVLNGNISIINFNPCGGTCSTSFIVRKFGQLYGDLPVPVRDGYIFDGWYSERNGKGAKYTSDMKYWGKNETVTWYANWKIDGSIINFDPCGGTCSTSFIVKKFGELYGTLPTPKRDGYIFDGWYSEKNGKGTKYTSDMKYWGKNETVTWYANWKIDGSIINFDPCGGTCSTSFIVRKFGQLYGDLPVPVRDGYIFDGWYSERNGKGAKYTSDMKYWGKNETVTWYANWKIDGSIINFDPCGGTCSTSFIVKKFGELYGTLPTPKRDGYIFDGWYSEKNGKGTKYTSDMKYWGKNETVTWYANWIQNSPDIDLPHSVLFPKTNTYTQGQFTDVPASQWFTGNVAAAVEFGLMKGNSVSTFNPYGDVTLAEAITMAARIHSIYTTGDESFVQASGNAWYQVYLDYAYQNGIIDLSYYGADVQKKATRAQYAEIFANALPDEALSSQNDVPDNAIPDVSVSAPYAPAVYKLYRAGILAGGDANGTFSPLTYITRAESATIVARMADSDNRMSFSL